MPRTITIAPDSGVFRASVTGAPHVTSTGNTEDAALASLAGKIAEYGWDWPEPKKPLTPSETHANPVKP